MNSSRTTWGTSLVLLAAFFGGIAHARARSDEVVPAGKGLAAGVRSASEDLPLSQVVNSRMTGLSLLDFQARSQLKALSEKYIFFRKSRNSTRNPASATVKQGWIATCTTAETKNIFCRESEIQELTGSETDLRGKAKKKARAPGVEVDQAHAALRSGDVEEAMSSSESAISQALRRFSSQAPLSVIAEKTLKLNSCDAVPLNTMLAQKLEEYLPEADASEQVLKLHEHAANCEKASEWSARSKYRLSLLLVSKGEWEKAEKWLVQLAQDRDTDYYARSLYWRARSAKMRGDQLGFEQARSRLLREFPIHYHSLLLSGRTAFNSAQNLHLPEPSVRLESAKLGAAWNERVRAIELLQERGATEHSRVLFEALEQMLDQAEPEARLYLAVLQHRNGNAIGTFRALSSLFRDHPAVLSRETLSFFFPLTKQHRHILYSVTGGGLDPYIIAALIRQESGFVNTARSPAGALGLMQLMPATARRLDRVSRRELMDGRTNVRLGVKFFRQLLQRFDGKVDLALAGYNAGPERVDDWQKRYRTEDPVLFVDLIPFRETRDYVSLISRNYYWYLQIYARHIFEERLEAGRSSSKTERRVASRKPASGDLPLEFSLFSAH